MTAKPHGDAPELALAEIDAISGGVVRRRRLHTTTPPKLARVPLPCPMTPVKAPSPCPMTPVKAPTPCPMTPKD